MFMKKTRREIHSKRYNAKRYTRKVMKKVNGSWVASLLVGAAAIAAANGLVADAESSVSFDDNEWTVVDAIPVTEKVDSFKAVETVPVKETTSVGYQANEWHVVGAVPVESEKSVGWNPSDWVSVPTKPVKSEKSVGWNPSDWVSVPTKPAKAEKSVDWGPSDWFSVPSGKTEKPTDSSNNNEDLSWVPSDWFSGPSVHTEKPKPTEEKPKPTEEKPKPEQPTEPLVKAQNEQAAAVEAAVIDLVNKFRAANGLAPLAVNSKLVDAARLNTKNLADKDIFNHDHDVEMAIKAGYLAAGDQIYKGNGKSIFKAGHPASTANLAYTSNSNSFDKVPTAKIASDIVNGWFADYDQKPRGTRGHRTQMLTPEWKDTGVGVYFSRNAKGDYEYYGVQYYGVPALGKLTRPANNAPLNVADVNEYHKFLDESVKLFNGEWGDHLDSATLKEIAELKAEKVTGN